jgi:ribosomal protein S18 acetylase RimI-like enzyme
MQITQAIQSDIAAIMQLVKRVVPIMQKSGNFQWDNEYPNPEVFGRDVKLGQLWLAKIDDAIAGIAAITMDQDEEYRQVGWDITEPAIVVHRLAVDPGFQGKGVANALMKQAEIVAKDKAIKFLRVDTNSTNAATQKLFPKLGYVCAGQIELAFRPGLSFLCYEKILVDQSDIER